jgi:hypothetical protein
MSCLKHSIDSGELIHLERELPVERVLVLPFHSKMLNCIWVNWKLLLNLALVLALD